MGSRGPAPKRSSERRRRNKDSKPETIAIEGTPVKAPSARDDWDPAAKCWYESLTESGQARFFEPSDWQAAQILAGEITAYMNASKRSAMMFSHIWSAMQDLLTTEGTRRRLKLEIDRTDPDAGASDKGAKVAKMDAYRKRFAG